MDVSGKVVELSGILVPLSRPTEAAAGETGCWRTRRPLIVYDRCKGCMLCWLYCPESAIARVKVGGRLLPVIDYRFCKGCCICATECPSKAIAIVDEV